MPVTILMCADTLNPRRVDEHFTREAEAVRALGGSIALIDHTALQHGDATMAVHRVPHDLGTVWYRGWTATSIQYTALASALWWGSLEAMRAQVRDLHRGGRPHRIPATVGGWLVLSLALGAFVAALAVAWLAWFAVNGQLASFETIKRFQILPVEFTIESGELTPTMKVKRKIVGQRFAREIEELFTGDGAAA